MNQPVPPVASTATIARTPSRAQIPHRPAPSPRPPPPGLWGVPMPGHWGGQGLCIQGRAVCYEGMNRSIFGPVVFNSAAPDDGNMIVLAKVATEAQQERWLKPIVEGQVRSSFAMTEPPPGCGSDPGMMQTRSLIPI